MRLNLRRRVKRSLPERVKQALMAATAPNQVWSIDFMSDSLDDGRKFRILNIINDFNRESLTIEIDTSLPARMLIRILQNLIEERGRPTNIRCDNGPEFITMLLAERCKEYKITIQFIQSGKPTQNAYVERKNGSMRRERLNPNLFFSLTEARCWGE